MALTGYLRRPLTKALLLVFALTAVGLAAGSAAAGTARRDLTVYSVANGVQYLSNADDAGRGQTNNPFDAAAKKLWPKVSTRGNGPFAGDVVVYSFDLYTGLKRKKAVGTAAYTCYYNYNSVALCLASYELGRVGTLLASGPVDFKKTGFKLVVTGGTKAYLGDGGQVSAVATANSAQRLSFTLLG